MLKNHLIFFLQTKQYFKAWHKKKSYQKQLKIVGTQQMPPFQKYLVCPGDGLPVSGQVGHYTGQVQAAP